MAGMKDMRGDDLKIGDWVMVHREQISALVAGILPEVIWMKAGEVMEVRGFRLRVRYGVTFFAWFDLAAVYKSQGPTLFGED
jgi:hypothetical protein